MSDVEAKILSIYKKICDLTEAKKLDWNTSSGGDFDTALGSYVFLLNEKVLNIRDFEGNLLGSVVEGPLPEDAGETTVAGLYKMAHKHSIKIDEKLDDLGRLLDEKAEYPF